MKVYSKVDKIPSGRASDTITKGCLVLEGGAFRGIYTSGVTDALMLNDINLQTTIGVSAGAMNGYNYVGGEIGRSSRINLTYRHDSRYVGLRAMARDHGVIGFEFAFNDLNNMLPFNEERFNDTNRRFIAVATNCITGKTEYFEKGKFANIMDAVKASASMPVVSSTVYLNGQPYLDGGCSTKIPLQWALDNNFEKIVVVKTRDRGFRYPSEGAGLQRIEQRLYRNYPKLLESLSNTKDRYNKLLDTIDELEKEGRIFVIAPSVPLKVKRLERNMEVMGSGYQLGYKDAMNSMDALKEYLNK